MFFIPREALAQTMKRYVLSQPLNQETPFWPLYPPFVVKFIKSKPEQGVNAQYQKPLPQLQLEVGGSRIFFTTKEDWDRFVKPMLRDRLPISPAPPDLLRSAEKVVPPKEVEV